MDEEFFTVDPDLQGRTWSYSLTKTNSGGWFVDCWKEDDTNHFTMYFKDYDSAKAEFERWRTR